MDTKNLFTACLTQASAVVTNVTPAQYSQPTPDTEWTVHDLLGHMLYELAWIPDVVNGKTIEEVGNAYDGDLIGDNAVAPWQTYAEKAENAVSQIELASQVHLSYGNFPAEHYIRQVATDLIIHAWDLGAATNQPVTFDTAVADAIYQDVLPKKDELSASGLFAPARDAPDSADIQTKLLAIYGRDASWRPGN